MTTATTKERPILFSGAMVRAVLDGTKTQTRRVIKPQPTVTDTGCPRWGTYDGPRMYMVPRRAAGGNAVTMTDLIGEYCPYGQPGDRLWVRETWMPWVDGQVQYQATALPSLVFSDRLRWRPSIHMPRALSRIALEVTAVRVERVQDISEADSRAEGVKPEMFYAGEEPWGADIYRPDWHMPFVALWDSINGPRGYGWDANPWVWVVEFKRVQP